MALRLLGACSAVLLLVFAAARLRKSQLRRGELAVVALLVSGLAVAAIVPDLLDPLLRSLGFERGQERRIIGLLVISNLLTFALLVRGFSRDDQLSDEVGALVDKLALGRLEDEGWSGAPGGITVVIPAYNEADNLPWVLEHIPQEVCGMAVASIVVADGCTDATEAVARAHGSGVIRRDLRRGSGAAVRVGCEAALRNNAKVIVTLDADGQHDPSEMEALVAPIARAEADMVQGSRVLGSFEVESRARSRGVVWFARLLTFLGRTKITDPSTGYRAISAVALRQLNLKQDQFYVSEVILEAARKGLRVTEVPITLRKRSSGTTKKPATLPYAWGFSKAIVRTWLR